MRIRNVKNKEEILNNSKIVIKNPEDYRGKWQEFFNNTNPIYIEIGMGKGKFILENAKKYPNINFRIFFMEIFNIWHKKFVKYSFTCTDIYNTRFHTS